MFVWIGRIRYFRRGILIVDIDFFDFGGWKVKMKVLVGLTFGEVFFVGM